MAELADARDSKSRTRKGIRVRPSVWAFGERRVPVRAMAQSIRTTRLSCRLFVAMLGGRTAVATRPLMGCSSMAEHSTVNRAVVGSTPTAPVVSSPNARSSDRKIGRSVCLALRGRARVPSPAGLSARSSRAVARHRTWRTPRSPQGLPADTRRARPNPTHPCRCSTRRRR